ncbi:MAG TPA: helix-hairpin-helix domain-containing protein [Chitinophagaceae bacterium]|jgi:AraC-like DNA-binding protein
MNNNYSTRLALTASEKKLLRFRDIKINEIVDFPIDKLRSALNSSKIRAMEIKALAEFQSIPSIGIKFAHDLITLGYYSLDELKTKNPVKLYDQFEKMIGAWADPCVEDQFRLVVEYAKNAQIVKNWWDFTSARKQFREKYGYAPDRPKKAWYELEQYNRLNNVPAKSIFAKKEVLQKIRESMTYIKKYYTYKLTLTELSKIALISRFHFQRIFKSVYNVSPSEFITHLRLKKACQLLIKTKKPVLEIMMLCGFENSSSFIRLFKKKFKQTPVSYRRIKVP